MQNVVFCNNGPTDAGIIYFRACVPTIWTLLTTVSVRPPSEFWILERLFGQPVHHMMVTPPLQKSTAITQYSLHLPRFEPDIQSNALLPPSSLLLCISLFLVFKMARITQKNNTLQTQNNCLHRNVLTCTCYYCGNAQIAKLTAHTGN